jgi:hypothetical protein
LLTLAVITPFISWYHKLDLQLKFKYVIIPWICLIFALLAIIWLIDTVREEDKEKKDKESNWANNKFENSEDDFNNCYENISVNNKIALMQRLRELKCWKFEEVVEMLFRFKWYNIEKGPNYYWDMPQVDWWKDLIISKDNSISSVQIKKLYDRPVNLIEVESFKWVIWNQTWYFVTTSVFSDKSKKFANEHWIHCVDYDNLYCVISKLSDKNKKDIENFINNSKNIQKDLRPKPRTCKKCWAPMVFRKKWWYWCLRYNYYEKEQCKCREFYK